MGEVGLEALMTADQPLQLPGLRHRERFLRAAPRTGQVNVLAVFTPVILGSRFEMGMRQDPEFLQQVEGPVDGGGVHAGDPVPDAPGHRGGGDVAIRGHDLGNDRPPLRRHAEPA